MANKPNGNLTGIKSAMLDRLNSLYDFKQGLDEFASFELLSELCACSGEINREISVYISRDGGIVDVSVGDSAKVSMPSMRLVRNEDRLCGVRCIHTHPSGGRRLSGVDLGTLRSMEARLHGRLSEFRTANPLSFTRPISAISTKTQAAAPRLCTDPCGPTSSRKKH